MSNSIPKIISGGNHKDERGQLEFFNSFDMTDIKRLYFTTHFNVNVIRAWQGHIIENRWFLCVKGSFIVKLCKIDNWTSPSEYLKVSEYQLNSKNKEILFIPSGFVNGFKALETDSKLMIMSNYCLNELENDQVRFDQNKWTKWGN